MNNRIASAFLVISSLSLGGCAAWFSASVPTWPWQDSPPCAGQCTNAEAIKAYVKANGYCREVQNYYEAGGARAQSNKLAVGLVGSLAGAVVAPVANGDAAKAWSGLSGATNAMQASIEEAFSTSVAAKRRTEVAEAAKAGESKYTGTAEQKVIASINMARACSMSAAKADAATLKAITQ